ncbi:phosphohistidine phosphatase [Kineosphaera limosa]|uniref:Phosphohistidine phosphatase n=1 Tax=Kineosphaera limosa NBRC 100340 TaxID=1184609 RepID=K6W949_9MICO|nr:histidine phosphatase family protein [Kineosphaera limosa]NYD99523.1 phosphohistidine phosphatase [Kineosphaera limosa]GAB95720.1 hypothetical protein KILIM_025_00570 [Kineosphaera limosa NBRC 100340]
MSKVPRSDATVALDGDATAEGNGDLRLLVLMRHAEAQGFSSGGDLGRELTAAGAAAAQEVGRWLSDQGVRPDAVVVSPSTRTRQTWEGLRAAGLSADSAWADEALYDADPEDIVESVQSVPDDVRTLVVIGHAPGIPFLAGGLARRLPQGAGGEAGLGWPPAAVAVIGHRGSWTAFPDEESAIVAFRRP